MSCRRGLGYSGRLPDGIVNGLHERQVKARLRCHQQGRMGRKGKSNRQLYVGAAAAAGTQRRADVGCAGIGVMLGDGNVVIVGSVMRAKIAV
jgi:hypothetical protein